MAFCRSFERMNTRALNLIVTLVLAGALHGSLYAQGVSADNELPDPDKYNLENIMISSGDGDSDLKFVYKPVSESETDPKDSVNGTSSINTGTSNQAAATVTKIRSEKVAPATKESVTKQSKNQEEVSKAKNDDSIMSFHFLYYIIEKYKLQDIVD